MIVKPFFPKFRNSELVQFLNDSVAVCKQQNVDQLQLGSQVADLDTKTIAINAVFKITQGSSITEQITALDARRDESLIGIRTCAEGMTHHFDAATRVAAQAILNSFDKYGKNLYLLNFQAETSTINSLLNDWAKDTKLAEAIVTLTLTDWANELKTTNDLFNEMYLSRVGEKASKDDIKFVELRKSSIISFKEVVKHIEARATLANDTAYDAVIKLLNALIEKYNRLVAGRKATDDKVAPAKA